MGAFYLISGNEDYAVKERANEMMRALCGDPPDDNPSLEIIRGDSDNEKAPQVLDKLLLSLDSPAFFSSEKIVWLKHFLKFDEAFAEPSTKKKPSRIDRLTEEVKANFYSNLENEKNAEITARMASEITQQIEQCLMKMAEVVEIPL